MAKVGLNVCKRPDGRYEGRYKKGRDEHNKLVYGSVYARTKKEAVKKVMEKQREHEDYENVRICRADGSRTITRPEKKGCKLGDWLTVWLARKLREVKETSYGVYETRIRKHIRPALGEVLMEEMDEDKLWEFVKKLKEKGLAPGTVHAVCSLLHSVLLDAREKGMVSAIPEKLFWPKKERAQEARHLQPKERTSILEEAMRRECYEVAAALYTGMRIGEIAGLQWRDIDFQKGSLKVQRTVQRVPVRGEGARQSKKRPARTRLAVLAPKSQASVRELPITPAFLVVLKLMWERSRKNPEDYVFATKKHPERPADPRTFQRKFKRLCMVTGVKDAHFHTLRHTFATVCLESGFDMESLRSLMGHSSIKITLQYYGHSTVEHRERLMKEYYRLAS